MSDLLIPSFLVSDVSKSLRSLTKHEQMSKLLVFLSESLFTHFVGYVGSDFNMLRFCLRVTHRRKLITYARVQVCFQYWVLCDFPFLHLVFSISNHHGLEAHLSSESDTNVLTQYLASKYYIRKPLASEGLRLACKSAFEA